jgi:hypothetical protein
MRLWIRATGDGRPDMAFVLVGGEELFKTPGRVLLEVGPGTTLSTLAKLHLRGEAGLHGVEFIAACPRRPPGPRLHAQRAG